MGQAYTVKALSGRTLRALNYVPEIEALRELRGADNTCDLGEMLAALGPAYARGFTRHDCTPEFGEELLSQSDMFAAEPQGRVIRGDALHGLEDYRIKRWQVLLAGNGTLGENELYGRAIIADGRLEGKLVGSDANVLHFAEPGSTTSLYCYAFLCTKLGIRAVRSTSYGTKNLRHRKDILADLPIPLADLATMERVAALIRRTVEQRELYLSKVREARGVVEQLPEMQEALAMCQDRRARCVTWSKDLPTLCGWNYASTGGALAHLLGKWQGRLGDIVEPKGIFNGPRFARQSCKPPHGVSFCSQRDVFLVRPVPRRIVHPGFSSKRLFTRPDSLLVGGQGTLGEGEIFGRVAYVDEAFSKYALTQHILRIWPTAGHAGSAYAYLSTKVGFRLMRSTAVGTKLMSLRSDLMKALPIPDLDEQARSTAEVAIAEGMAARTEANRAESEAVQIIEEEVLPQWLA